MNDSIEKNIIEQVEDLLTAPLDVALYCNDVTDYSITVEQENSKRLKTIVLLQFGEHDSAIFDTITSFVFSENDWV